MKYGTLICLIVIASSQVINSILTQSGCGTHCTQCWTNSLKCAECQSGYFFDYVKNPVNCFNAEDYEKGRLIPGFKRSCAECGPHNYLDDSYLCQACPRGCDVCDNTGKCTKCYSSQVVLNNYNEIESDGTCKCDHGNALQLNLLCQCNNDDYWLSDSYVCKQCDKCNRDKAKCINSLFATIPQYFWDDDNIGCPMPCHESCDSCDGPTNTDCNHDDDDNLLCRNSALWEEVTNILVVGECFCVCHAKEVVVDGKSTCVCEENRIATDTCVDKVCSTKEQLNKMQCNCKQGYIEGEVDMTGKVPCIQTNNITQPL